MMRDVEIVNKSSALTQFVEKVNSSREKERNVLNQSPHAGRFSQILNGIRKVAHRVSSTTPLSEAQTRREARLEKKDDEVKGEKKRDKTSTLNNDVSVRDPSVREDGAGFRPLSEVNGKAETDPLHNGASIRENDGNVTGYEVNTEDGASHIVGENEKMLSGDNSSKDVGTRTLNNGATGTYGVGSTRGANEGGFSTALALQGSLVTDEGVGGGHISEIGLESSETAANLETGGKAGAKPGEKIVELAQKWVLNAPGAPNGETQENTNETLLQQIEKATFAKNLGLGNEKPAASVEGSETLLGTMSVSGRPGSFGADARQNGGMGQNANLSPSFIHSQSLPSAEETSAIKTSGADFRTMFESGLSTLDERAISRQVSQNLRLWRPGQNEPIRFLLEPKHLGALQIDIFLKENGVSAHMVTSDPFVKELLTGNQGFLQNGLKNHGLHITQFSVDLGDGRGFLNEQKQGRFLERTAFFTEENDPVVSVQSSNRSLKAGNGRVSLYI